MQNNNIFNVSLKGSAKSQTWEKKFLFTPVCFTMNT